MPLFVLFGGEKKLNLCGLEDWNFYWHDLYKEDLLLGSFNWKTIVMLVVVNF